MQHLMKKEIQIILIFLFVSLLLSCNKRICDEMWASVIVRIIDSNENPVKLNLYYTIRLSDYDTIYYYPNDTHSAYSFGFYQVIDDKYQSILENKTESFNFIGFLNDSMIINELYEVSADECHIYKVSGKDKIIL